MNTKVKTFLCSNRYTIAFFILILILFWAFTSYLFIDTAEYQQLLQSEYSAKTQILSEEVEAAQKELKEAKVKYAELKKKYQASQKELEERQEEIEALQIQTGEIQQLSGAQNKAETQTVTQSAANAAPSKQTQTGSYIGDFTITYYCGENYPHICGTGNGVTASGATATVGVTIAADPNVLPLGTTVYIEGLGERTVQDTGGSIVGNRIDVFVETHSEAMANGTHVAKVYMT